MAAGTIARKFFRSDLTIRKKGAIDLVTEADVAVEQEIRARIERRFPTHTFLGEESGGSSAAGAPIRWIVDPIDGTTNFAHGLALFCTSIAGTTIPSDFRCAALDFALGLYEAPRRDDGGADGSLVFRDDPCTRAAPRTPPRPTSRLLSRAGGVAFAVT